MDGLDEIQGETPAQESLNHTTGTLFSRLVTYLGILWQDRIRYSHGWKIARYSSVILLFLAFFIFIVPLIQEGTLILVRKGTPQHYTIAEPEKYTARVAALERELRNQKRRFEALTPLSAYLIVNTFENKIWLYRGKKLVREGMCSTGSYILLESGDEQKWIFKTPRGMFRVQGKTTSPVWRKPDWAFVEEGLPIPPPTHPSRYEYGVLGDYALSIGDGYLIHGTLYQRFLGLPVTHGCIRLNDDDLKAVYSNLDIGSRVYIY